MQSIVSLQPDATELPSKTPRMPAMTPIVPAGELPAEFPDNAPFGLLTVHPRKSFTPGDCRAGLPSDAPGIPGGLLPQLVPFVNGSKWSQDSTRWAVVLENGCLLLVYTFGLDRPRYPDALPRICEPCFGSKMDALQIAWQRNAERLKTAVVPREWTVVVRNLRFQTRDDVDRGISDSLRNADERVNLFGNKLWDVYDRTLCEVGEMLPEGFEILPATGCGPVNGENRRWTDEECRIFSLEVAAPRFDVTGDIRGQIAAGLEDLAMNCLQSAIEIRNTPPLTDEDYAEADAVETAAATA